MMRRFASPVLAIWILVLLGACAPRQPQAPHLGLNFPPLEFNVPEVERMELPNGIRLYLREDHELPLVQMTVMVGAGSITEPAERTGMGGLFASALRTGGAGERDPEQFEEYLERLAANLGIATDTYVTTLDLSLRSTDLESGLSILSDVLRRPRFDPRRLEVARNQAIEGIRRQFDQPGSVAWRALAEAVYGDHPLGRTPTEESVSSVSREHLIDFHRRHFHPNNLWLAISGDFDRRQLMALLEQTFGDWPQGNFAAQTIPPVPAAREGSVRLATMNIPQTTILLGDLGIDKDDPDLHAVRVMNWILGGGSFNSRLMREIRSTRGLAYSVYSVFQIGRVLPGPFVAGSETKSGSTMEVVRLMQGLMEEMRSTAVSEQELALAKESLINSFVFAFTDSHDVLTQTMRLDYFDYPEGYLEKYRAQVAAVTAEDVLRVARKYLHPGRQTVILVGNPAAFDEDPAALGLPVEKVKMER